MGTSDQNLFNILRLGFCCNLYFWDMPVTEHGILFKFIVQGNCHLNSLTFTFFSNWPEKGPVPKPRKEGVEKSHANGACVGTLLSLAELFPPNSTISLSAFSEHFVKNRLSHPLSAFSQSLSQVRKRRNDCPI